MSGAAESPGIMPLGLHWGQSGWSPGTPAQSA
jgi:hypothetical protein